MDVRSQGKLTFGIATSPFEPAATELSLLMEVRRGQTKEERVHNSIGSTFFDENKQDASNTMHGGKKPSGALPQQDSNKTKPIVSTVYFVPTFIFLLTMDFCDMIQGGAWDERKSVLLVSVWTFWARATQSPSPQEI